VVLYLSLTAIYTSILKQNKICTPSTLMQWDVLYQEYISQLYSSISYVLYVRTTVYISFYICKTDL
jgi:hypothetical protein